MIKNIAFVAVSIILIVLIYAATRPDAFHVERSIEIKAKPDKIFPLINDFHQWDNWTPYNKDPAMKKAYSEPANGKGARYTWEGNKNVGKGEIAITDASPPARITFDLHMIEPFEGHNHVVFALNAAGDTTTVSWIMGGTQSYFVKIMGLFFNMDEMVGKDFEVGLANLKALAEKN